MNAKIFYITSCVSDAGSLVLPLYSDVRAFPEENMNTHHLPSSLNNNHVNPCIFTLVNYKGEGGGGGVKSIIALDRT